MRRHSNLIIAWQIYGSYRNAETVVWDEIYNRIFSTLHLRRDFIAIVWEQNSRIRGVSFSEIKIKVIILILWLLPWSYLINKYGLINFLSTILFYFISFYWAICLWSVAKKCLRGWFFL